MLYHPDTNRLMHLGYLESEGQQEPIAERMIRGEKGLVLTTIDGKKQYVGFSPVAATGWSVGVVIPYSQAMSQLEAYVRNIVVFYTLTVLLLVIVIYYLMKYLLKEIPILIHSIRSFSEGNLGVSVKVKSADEIGQIASAFQQMMYDIRTIMQKIQRDAYYGVLTQLPADISGFIERRRV